MSKLHTLACLACAATVLTLSAAAQAAAPNLIANGNFESGLTGFTSDYVVGGDSWSEGVLNVGTDPKQFHSLWDSVSDGSNMLFVNGSTAAEPRTVWSETVSLSKGASYDYSGSVISLYADNPALLQAVATIGGKDYVVGTVQLNGGGSTPQWQSWSGTLVSPFSGNVVLKLIDLNQSASGNDFALDNLSLTQTAAVPEPQSWAMALAGLAALGFIARRRQRRG